LKINEKVKNKSKNSCQKPRSIIAEETKNIENENLANLNKLQSLKKLITRERNKGEGVKISNFTDIPDIFTRDL
jgi:hypothetical protein